MATGGKTSKYNFYSTSVLEWSLGRKCIKMGKFASTVGHWRFALGCQYGYFKLNKRFTWYLWPRSRISSLLAIVYHLEAPGVVSSKSRNSKYSLTPSVFSGLVQLAACFFQPQFSSTPKRQSSLPSLSWSGDIVIIVKSYILPDDRKHFSRPPVLFEQTSRNWSDRSLGQSSKLSQSWLGEIFLLLVQHTKKPSVASGSQKFACSSLPSVQSTLPSHLE